MTIQNSPIRFGAIVAYRHPTEDSVHEELVWTPFRLQVVPPNKRPTPETGINRELPANAFCIGAGIFNPETAHQMESVPVNDVATFTNKHFTPDGKVDKRKIARMDTILGGSTLAPIKGWIAELLAQSDNFRSTFPKGYIRTFVMTQLLDMRRTMERTFGKNADNQDIVEYKVSKPHNMTGP